MKCRFSTFIAAVTLFTAIVAAAPRVAEAGVRSREGKIAFVLGVDLYTVNPDGSDLQQLTNFGSTGFALQSSWSADGHVIVFSFVPASTGNGEIWDINADGSNLHRVHRDANLGDTSPHFSPDGSNIVFTRCNSFQCAIYRIQSDGTRLRALTHFNHNPDIGDFHASYSPDGSTIVFASIARGGVLCAVYLMNADGSNIRPLTPPENLGFMPAWSPDGTEITFSANGIIGILDEEIWRINVDGTRLTQLTNNNQNWNGYLSGPHDFWPSWSPEGDAIAFEEDAPDYSSSAVYLMNSDGGGMRTLQAPQTRVAPRIQARGGRARFRMNAQDLQLLENNGTYPNWGPERE